MAIDKFCSFKVYLFDAIEDGGIVRVTKGEASATDSHMILFSLVSGYCNPFVSLITGHMAVLLKALQT